MTRSAAKHPAASLTAQQQARLFSPSTHWQKGTAVSHGPGLHAQFAMCFLPPTPSPPSSRTHVPDGEFCPATRTSRHRSPPHGPALPQRGRRGWCRTAPPCPADIRRLRNSGICANWLVGSERPSTVTKPNPARANSGGNRTGDPRMEWLFPERTQKAQLPRAHTPTQESRASPPHQVFLLPGPPVRPELRLLEPGRHRESFARCHLAPALPTPASS